MPQLYFDHNASTPLHPEVAAAMTACLNDYGNPSSIHQTGRNARSLIESARESLAHLLSVAPSEIIFTSGGTEGNNLAILGAFESGKLPGRHLVCSTFEHPSVLEAFRRLESAGAPVTWVEPSGDGVVAAATVEQALRPDTGLVSVMAANNEVGTLQPTAEIGGLLRGRGILFHCDGVQALGKLPEIQPRAWQADYLALSAHKINGPKGVGALYVRKGVPFQGLALGGSQERSFRGGTENLLGIVGFGKAVEIVLRDGATERSRLEKLRQALEAELRSRIPDLVVNGEKAGRLPNTLNISLPGCRSDMLVMGLDMRDIAVSAGSACASGSVKYSHVLLAMGKDKSIAGSSLRFSLGLGNNHSDLGPLADQVAEVANSVRGL